MCPNPQGTADLVTFTEEILNGKLHFLCSVRVSFADGKFSPSIIYFLGWTKSYLLVTA